MFFCSCCIFCCRRNRSKRREVLFHMNQVQLASCCQGQSISRWVLSVDYPETVIFRRGDRETLWSTRKTETVLQSRCKIWHHWHCYFVPEVLYLGVEGTWNQRWGEGGMNSAIKSESEIRHDCWEFGLSTLAIDDLCSAGRTSQFWSYLRCWLLIFSSSRGKFSQSAPRDRVEQFSILESLKLMWRMCVYGGRRVDRGIGCSVLWRCIDTWEDHAPFWPKG